MYLPADGPVSNVDPYFDLVDHRNISAVEGKKAKLSCTVRNLGDRMVQIIAYYANPASGQYSAVTTSSKNDNVTLLLCLLTCY